MVEVEEKSELCSSKGGFDETREFLEVSSKSSEEDDNDVNFNLNFETPSSTKEFALMFLGCCTNPKSLPNGV